MILRYEHLLLATAFFFGWIASAVGQTTLTTDRAVASHEWMEEFDRFIPKNAELLIVYRPKLLAQHELLGRYLGSTINASHWLPKTEAKIEALIVASSRDTLDKVMRSEAEAKFEEIANQLSDTGSFPAPETTRSSIANLLNNDFGGLMQFEKRTDWTVIANWLDEKNSATGKYQKRFWRGFEALDCGSNKCCIVLKLDDRTWVFGNKQQLAKTIDARRSPNSTLSQWLDQLVTEQFEGEFFIGTDLKSSASDWSDHMPPESPWAMFDEIRGTRFQVDLSHSPLMKCQFEFDRQELGAEFSTRIKNLLRDELKNLSEGLENVEAPFAGWPADKMLEVARSIELTHDDGVVTIELPRPDDFDEMLNQTFEQLASFNRQMELDQQAAFDNVARDLEAAKPPETTNVLVFNKELKAGVVIKSSDLATETWPTSLVADDAMVVKRTVVGNLTSRPVFRGEPVSSKHLKARAK